MTEVVHGTQALSQTLGSCVVTIGNFDGIHLGHRQILNEAIRRAKCSSINSLVYTFRPHPRQALDPSSDFELLMTYDERVWMLRTFGFDWVIEEPFSRDFSTLTADQFFSEILIGKLSAKNIIVGYDFSFGRQREGDLDLLSQLCKKAQVELIVVSPVQINGKTISSSLIRDCLRHGKVKDASFLLGYPFFYSGVIGHGDRRGSELGYPTANLTWDPKLCLPHGVYITRFVCGEMSYSGVTNVGVRLTFDASGANSLTIETHLLDQDLNLYGKSVQVEFLERIRDELKFANARELREQIKRDVEQARSFFDRAAP